MRIGREEGAREVRKLRSRLLAEHGAEGEFQEEQDKAAGQVGLSHPMAVEEGVWEYLFRANAEAKAVLEAAIGPLRRRSTTTVAGTRRASNTAGRRW